MANPIKIIKIYNHDRLKSHKLFAALKHFAQFEVIEFGALKHG